MSTEVKDLKKNVLINSKACTGCRFCQLVCSVVKEGESNPDKARIHIECYSIEGLMIPRVCINCKNAPCIKACPRGALETANTGVVILHYDKCDNCAKCIPACPFNAFSVTLDGKVLKCDLCGGDPECVKVCVTEAIQFMERNQGKQKIVKVPAGVHRYI